MKNEKLTPYIEEAYTIFAPYGSLRLRCHAEQVTHCYAYFLFTYIQP